MEPNSGAEINESRIISATLISLRGIVFCIIMFGKNYEILYNYYFEKSSDYNIKFIGIVFKIITDLFSRNGWCFSEMEMCGSRETSFCYHTDKEHACGKLKG